MVLTSHSLLGLDALYDPPRLMVSEATLDVPSATTTPDAEPQQGASTAHTTPAPTAASKILPDHSQESPDSHPAATEQASGHDAGNIAPATVAVDSQTAGSLAGTQSDASSNTDSSPVANDAESNDPSPTLDGPLASNAESPTSHTAMMESQTPELVAGSQGDAASTTASGSLANDASTDTLSDSAGASPSSTSVGVSLVSNMLSCNSFALFLLLGYLIW